jgi:hypothetical protein
MKNPATIFHPYYFLFMLLWIKLTYLLRREAVTDETYRAVQEAVLPAKGVQLFPADP